MDRVSKAERELVRKKQTNADKIRQMPDEELALLFSGRPQNCPPTYVGGGFLRGPCQLGCVNCWIDWLKQEV